MISVIVPVYNVSDYLNECIESIIQQTYKNLEIILINDGSTDNSLQICKDYAEKDTRIIVLDKQNGGQSSARNLGLDYAMGEYIAFIDSDDAVSLDVFEENTKILEKDKSIDVLQFPVYKNYGLKTAYISSFKTGPIEGTENLFREWIENYRISWIVCDKIFKREVFNQIRFVDGMFYEDNYIITNVLDSIDKLYVSDKGLYYYYYRNNTITTSPHTLKKELDTQKVSLRILKSLKRFNSLQEVKIKILSRIFNVYLSLSKNYKIRHYDNLFIEEIQQVKFITILCSKISNKEKLKLVLLKIVGIENYIKLY